MSGTNTTPILKAENIHRRLGGSANSVHVLRGVSLELEKVAHLVITLLN